MEELEQVPSVMKLPMASMMKVRFLSLSLKLRKRTSICSLISMFLVSPQEVNLTSMATSLIGGPMPRIRIT